MYSSTLAGEKSEEGWVLPVFVWLPEKQAPKRGFKFFVVKVSLGGACGRWGIENGEGRKQTWVC